MPKIYISGPMTGMPDLNFPAFNAAAAALRTRGHTVINPAELNPDPGHPWAYYMRRDIAAMMDCDAIYLLPGWTKSRGARLEQLIAVELGFIAMGSIA